MCSRCLWEGRFRNHNSALEKYIRKIADISYFCTKKIKSTDEQVLTAVDGEMCVEQAEKLRIVLSRMDIYNRTCGKNTVK